MSAMTQHRTQFFLEIIKPSHYDDEGYVIQWVRGFIPSNSLACLYALIHSTGERRVLGENVDIVASVYDEMTTVIPVQAIIRKIRQGGGRGLVLMAGVQTNQFPRAADLARAFRAAGIAVVVGGFHVSGCLAMLPDLPPEVRTLQAEGVTLFAGEAEGRMDQLLTDAFRGQLPPLYNFLKDLPDLRGQPTPFLPPDTVRQCLGTAPFDAGRGCPFQCSFCTIINVQGRKSRYRDADDIERLVRDSAAQGVKRLFITDDDLARNRNWEPIFDRLIWLREKQNLRLRFTIQVDTQCHKIPRFIEKATRAGCSRVFLGMESINPENLLAAKKVQNHVSEYRTMLQRWRERGVLTYAGYILGFPADTPASIERDIKTIQREIPIDILEFFMLTPLPGSADHKLLHQQGVWMDPDMNRYDAEHMTTRHPRMSAAEWQDIYRRAWHLYYSPEHIETLLRRAHASGPRAKRLAAMIFLYYGSYRFENVHPLQCGILRRKVRTTRRPGLPQVHPLLFYPQRLWELCSTYAAAGSYYLWLQRLRKRIEQDPSAMSYTDQALSKPAAAANRPTRPGGSERQACVPGDSPMLPQLDHPQSRSA